MIHPRRPFAPVCVAGFILLVACQATEKELLKPPEEQAALRAMQSRVYDTPDEQEMLRAAIATMQDLGFVIDDANSSMGIVSATRLQGRQARLMVTIRKQSENRLVVRASIQVGITTVTDPEVYQQFFASLSKGIFLTAHEIE